MTHALEIKLTVAFSEPVEADRPFTIELLQNIADALQKMWAEVGLTPEDSPGYITTLYLDAPEASTVTILD